MIPRRHRVDDLGLNTGWDPAALLTHEGEGHRLKINKAGAADTASETHRVRDLAQMIADRTATAS